MRKSPITRSPTNNPITIAQFTLQALHLLVRLRRHPLEHRPRVQNRSDRVNTFSRAHTREKCRPLPDPRPLRAGVKRFQWQYVIGRPRLIENAPRRPLGDPSAPPAMHACGEWEKRQIERGRVESVRAAASFCSAATVFSATRSAGQASAAARNRGVPAPQVALHQGGRLDGCPTPAPGRRRRSQSLLRDDSTCHHRSIHGTNACAGGRAAGRWQAAVICFSPSAFLASAARRARVHDVVLRAIPDGAWAAFALGLIRVFARRQSRRDRIRVGGRLGGTSNAADQLPAPS